MGADIQLFINYTDVIAPSSAVSFFRSTPRWPSAPKTLDFTLDYLRPVLLTALIPIIVFLILTLFLLTHLTIRYTCRETVVDARIHSLQATKRSSLLQLTLGAILTFIITLFIGLSLISVTSVNVAASEALDIIQTLISDISRMGFAFVDVTLLLERRISSFNESSALTNLISDTLGDFVQPALTSVKNYVLGAYPDVQPLRVALQELVGEIDDVLDVVKRAVNIVWVVLVVIVILLLSAPLLLFGLGAMPVSKRWRCGRIAAHVVLLLVPGLLAWVLVGVSSGVGAAVGDVCESVHGYRDVLLGRVEKGDVGENVLVRSNFTCPEGVEWAELDQQFGGTVDALKGNELAGVAVEVVLNSSVEEIVETAEWSRNEVGKYVNCDALRRFSGQIEFVVCGGRGYSSVDGIYGMWVSFVGLAISLVVAIIASLVGMRVGAVFNVYNPLE